MDWLRRSLNVQRLTRALRHRLAERIPDPARRLIRIAIWRLSGRPVPPPHVVKQELIRRYGRIFDLRTLVETGTYLGEMVEAQRRHFEQVLSIELSPTLYQAAREKFAGANNVTLLQGDSADLIESVVARLAGPALFWLDGHYSAGITALGALATPVREELDVILRSRHDHVILVDDARCFGTGDYPNLDAVSKMVTELRPGWTCRVADDVIRIHPPVHGSRDRAADARTAGQVGGTS